MRNASWVVVLLAACGGTNPPPQTPPSNHVPVTQTPTAPPEPAGLTADVCQQRADELGPIRLREDQVGLRRGTGATTFGDIASSKEAPIEVCMPAGQRAWISSVTCANGAKPSAAARSGSVGPGGTCGSVIDLYIIKCAEKEYEVFMDMYMCPPGQGL